MLFTIRFLVLFSLGIVPLAFAHKSALFLYVAAGYDIVLVGLAVFDFIAGPGRNTLKINRRCENKLSLGTENPIWIDIHNSSRFPLRIEIKEEYPIYPASK